MIHVDAGNELFELLVRAKQLGDRSRLDIAVPFFDTDSQLWELLLAAVGAGSRVRLMTRPAEDALYSELFDRLMNQGVRVVQLPRVHAKSFLLSDRKGRHSMGWIGSHNLTKASERSAQELGIVFAGRGEVGSRLMQQALVQLDAWDSENRANRKSA